MKKKNKIKVIKGKAKFETDHRVRVVQGNKEEVVDGESLLSRLVPNLQNYHSLRLMENGF